MKLRETVADCSRQFCMCEVDFVGVMHIPIITPNGSLLPPVDLVAVSCDANLD